MYQIGQQGGNFRRIRNGVNGWGSGRYTIIDSSVRYNHGLVNEFLIIYNIIVNFYFEAILVFVLMEHHFIESSTFGDIVGVCMVIVVVGVFNFGFTLVVVATT